jgi:uncharacterized protein
LRQSKREIKDKGRVITLLENAPVGRLGTVGKDGYPMIKPLNFVYVEGRIYFHSAREGEKIEDIQREGRVCFEVDLPMGFVSASDEACQASFQYQSVIVKGSAKIVEERGERLQALQRLMEKYQPRGSYGDFREEKLELTSVVRIDIEEMTGKERLV